MTALDSTQLEGARFCHVVACGQDGAIGQKGGMPWHIPEDLRFFKKITTGHCIVMGRKTFDSIGKALPGRRNIVITRDTSWQFVGVERLGSIEELVSMFGTSTTSTAASQTVYIIGGGELYRQTLSMVNDVYLTLIDARFSEADTHYPLHLLHEGDWSKELINTGVSSSGMDVRWWHYQRE